MAKNSRFKFELSFDHLVKRDQNESHNLYL